MAQTRPAPRAVRNKAKIDRIRKAARDIDEVIQGLGCVNPECGYEASEMLVTARVDLSLVMNRLYATANIIEIEDRA